MPVSAVQAAKRTPFKVSLALALQYEMAIKVSRDSADKKDVSSDKRSSTKVHRCTQTKDAKRKTSKSCKLLRSSERRLRRWDCQVDKSRAFADSSQVS